MDENDLKAQTDQKAIKKISTENSIFGASFLKLYIFSRSCKNLISWRKKNGFELIQQIYCYKKQSQTRYKTGW